MKSMRIALFVAALLVPLVLYFAVFNGQLSSKHGDWAEFGSYLSGTYGSLALFVLAYTTYLTRDQFRRQNEDNLYFRLFDSLQSRIAISEIEVDGKIFSGHECLKHIAKRFSEELSDEAVDLARLLLARAPENIDDTQLMKLLDAMGGKLSGTYDDQKAHFIGLIHSSGGFNERWEELKSHIGSKGSESPKVREALRSLGSVNFYKTSYKNRKHHYAAALHRVVQEHGGLLEGYLSTVIQIAEITQRAANRPIYESYLQSQLTRYEVIVIFYLLVGQESSIEALRTVREVGVLRRLPTIDCQVLMIDAPDVQTIDAELGHLFAEA